MSDLSMMAALASFGLIALGIFLLAGLKGWQGWLELKRLELSNRPREAGPASAMERIELADLRERIRKLEAIASCVDL